MANKKYNQPTKITNKDFLHTIASLIGAGLSALTGLVLSNRTMAQQPIEAVAPTPTPTPTPTPQLYGRNPQFETFAKKNPGDYQEILSAVTQAVPENNNLLRQLMLDLALEESGLKTKVKNPNSSATGAWQMTEGTAKYTKLPLEDRENATESAKVVKDLLEKGFLRWWETYKRGGATKTPINKLYTQEELSKFLR